MANPQFHAESSAKKYGGHWSEFIDIHEFMDSSKAAVSNNLHRTLTHNSWFVVHVLPKVFGDIEIVDGKALRTGTRLLSTGRRVPIKDIGEQHILEDFKMQFIPTPQDYLEHMEMQGWMNNGMGVPNRMKKSKETKQEIID